MSSGALRELFKYLGSYKKELVIVFVALFSVAAALLAIGYLFRNLVDNGLGAGAVDLLNQSIYMIIILIAVFAIASFFRSFYINDVGEKISSRIKRDIYIKLLKVDLVTFEELKMGDILSRLGSDVSDVGNLVTNFLSFLVRNMVMLIGGIILMIMQSPKLAFLVIFSVPILLLPLLWLSKIVRKLSRQVLAHNATLAAKIEESFTGIRTIHAYNQQDNFAHSFETQISDYAKLASRRLKMRSLFFALAISCVATAIISVIWIGSIDIINGKMSSGQMISFIYYSIIVGMSAGGVAEIFSELQGPLAALERVFELNSLECHEIYGRHERRERYGRHERHERDGRHERHEREGRYGESGGNGGNENDEDIILEDYDIVFEDVSFSYPSRPKTKVLNHLNAKFNHGKFYGIAGASGSGKSTILQLLLKFYHHNEGKILIGNHDINSMRSETLRRPIAYVAQDPSIFSGTIRSNISFSNPDATSAEIEKVAKLCGIIDFTKHLACGLDTEIGEKGVRLSGGQKQRIAIARSILYGPEILLLDEATSALDSDSEKKIMDNIRTSLKGKMVISIAHRVSSIEDADEILVIDKGTISARGSHESLLSKSAIYTNLVKKQNINI